MTTTMGVKLDEGTQQRLKDLGKRRDRSPHWLMRQAVMRYLEQEERHEHESAQDEARWQRYLATGQAVTHTDVEAWLRTIGTANRKPCPK